MTMLRSLVGAKSVAANDQLNAIALRDTADKVKVAESIIRTNDKSRGEVVVDVELLQINTSKLQELGVLLTDYTITQFLDPALQVGDSGAFRVSDLEFINQGDWLVTIPGFVYDFVKTSTEAQLLASPQVRISDGEQATVHIGEQVPIPVTTFNTRAPSAATSCRSPRFSTRTSAFASTFSRACTTTRRSLSSSKSR